ncbi:MAG: hypothetical protein AAGF83_27005 [Cyanobacteria bacterium P01_G01_bin.67]
MKLVNPLQYPLAVLVGGITLVIGVRLVQLPNLVVIPASVAITTGLAVPLSKRATSQIQIDNPELLREVKSIQQQSRTLCDTAETLRIEARRMLTSATQLELVSAVEYTCDRVLELPAKIDLLAGKLNGSDSLLSTEELARRIKEVERKAEKTSGVARQQLTQLAQSLRNNLDLARQGQDARQAQVVSLETMVSESAGILQQFQNRLRTSDLNNSVELNELKVLSEELKNMQDNVDLLIT